MSKSTRLPNTSARSPARSISARKVSKIAMLPLALTERVTPRWAKMSATLPTETTSPPSAASRSSSVSPGGGVVRSRRLPVRTKSSLRLPRNGRAMTRAMFSGSTSSLATVQTSISRSRPKASSCAAIWNTESADV